MNYTSVDTIHDILRPLQAVCTDRTQHVVYELSRFVCLPIQCVLRNRFLQHTSMCLDADVAKAFRVANSVLAVIGFTACCLTAMIIALKRSYRTCPLRLLLYLALVSLLCSITAGIQIVPAEIITALNGSANGHVVIRPEPGWAAACRTFGFLSNYFLLCKVSLTFVLCGNVFVTKCLRKELTNTRWEVAGLVSSMFFPLVLFSWLPFIHNSYGLSGTWCSIKDSCNNATSLGRDLAIGASIVPNMALYIVSAILVACVVTIACHKALCSYSRRAAFETFAGDVVLLLLPILLCAGYCVAIYSTVNDNDAITSGIGEMSVAAFTQLANILLPIIAFCNQRNSSSPLVQSLQYDESFETSSVKESTDSDWGHEHKSLLIKKSNRPLP